MGEKIQNSAVPCLKGVFPFRLGTTSYIIPADILPNVRYLADKVDDVQLILFESEESSNLPSPAVISELAAIGDAQALTYTVHFPLDLFLGSRDESVRTSSVDTCRRIIDLCAPLRPQTYALHFSADDPDDRSSVPSEDMPGWCDAHSRSLGALVSEVSSPRQLCVETLAYPFSLLDSIIETHDAGVCLDIGHLLRWGHDVRNHLEQYALRTHLMHIHGVKDGADHRELGCLDGELLDAVVTSMVPSEGECRVLTLEVFCEDDFNRSVQHLATRMVASEVMREV